MKRTLTAVVAAVLALGLFAGPASAATPPTDAGIVIGAEATVSKNGIAKPDIKDTLCASGTGGGIGLPVVNGLKKAYYDFSFPSTQFPQLGLSTFGPITGMHICGQIDPAFGLVGAACGMSAGSHGNGWATAGTNRIQFNDLGWDFSAASVFVVTGGARTVTNGVKKAAKSGVLALVSARNTGGQCAGKPVDPNIPKSGSMIFTVDFVYVIHPSIPVVKHVK